VVAGLFGRRRATIVWGGMVVAAAATVALATRLGLHGLRPETAVDVAPLLIFLAVSTAIAVVHEQTRRALERERDELQKRIAANQRLEAVGHLAAGIAHDFNNLLTVFRSAGDVLIEQLPTGHPLRPEAEAVCEASERGAGLAQQLLAFSRPEKAEGAVFDLGRSVAAAETILRRALPDTITLRIERHDEPSLVRGNAQRLVNVLLNLVINARDAMPTGGAVTVTVGRTVLAGGDPLDTLAPGPYATLAVRDEGSGIDDATLPHIFEPFFTTKTRERGSGLGLATAYGTVRGMKGEIRVETALGRGSTFTVLLPIEQGSVELAEPPRSESRVRASGPIVLVVDDQPPVVSAVRRLLASRGFTVLTATSGEQALSLAGERPEVDVLLTDVSMPSMNGIALSRRLRAIKPSIAVVYMSGYAEDAPMTRGLEQEQARIVRKPFDAETLVAEIEAAVARAETVPLDARERS
jgi:signal transduction histidine kinase/CheY-like chemotaxis protein